MTTNRAPTLVFDVTFDAQEAYEAEARGFLPYASVVLPSGATIPVVFWDPVRLQQHLEDEVAAGRPYVAEPGMIVLESITLANMERAVQLLFDEGYFDHLRPIPA